MVSGLGCDIGLGLGVDRGALVGDLGDVAVDVVGGVLHVLDPAVGKGDRVRSRDNTVGIAGLSGVEVGLGVVVGNTVGVGVGLRGLLGDWVVSRGSMDYRGRGGNRSSVVGRSRGMMHHWRHWAIGWSSMVNSMRHRMVDGMGNRVVHSVRHRVVDCMGHWVGNMVGNWVGNKTMVGNRVRKVGNLLDQRAGRGCRQQRGEDESLEKSLVSHLDSRMTKIGFSKSLHIHTISTFILFFQEVLKLTEVRCGRCCYIGGGGASAPARAAFSALVRNQLRRRCWRLLSSLVAPPKPRRKWWKFEKNQLH